jgi:acyl-coenzyme A thioesterase PaaI-like protein
MPPGVAVLTIEYKVNFLSPAAGELMLARGRVTKPGRNVTVCQGDVFALKGGREKVIATMLATMMTVRNDTLQD